jgi:hypothetical protein
MPNVITYPNWKVSIASVPPFKRTKELQEVNSAFELYSTNSTQPRLATLEEKFLAWEESTSAEARAERQKLSSAYKDLEFTIQRAAPTPVTTRANVTPLGWTLSVWDAVTFPWTREVVTNVLPPLSPSEMTRLNESFRRVKVAVDLARTAMLAISKRKQFTGANVPFEERTYRDYFGVYDEKRLVKVLENFCILHLVFQRGPAVVDMRNTEYGKKTYAACYRNNVTTKEAKGNLALNGTVRMFLGRSFFEGTSYTASTDSTVGTLVHEFAHGSFSAVDAPPVENSTWVLTPKELANPAHADYGETPELLTQASGSDKDKALAAFAPDIAIRNADCYGQFAKECLVQSKQ